MRSTVHAEFQPTALLETRALTRRDNHSHSSLLQPTDFRLCGGDRISITGSSGSGKSVFLRALALLDSPSAGHLLWQGQPISNAQVPHYRSRVCYLAQRPALIEGTVEDNLRFPYSLKTLRAQSFGIEAAKTLLDHAGKPSGFLNKNAADLSGGEAQIVSLIRSLQLNPQVMLLDEPTSALDPTSAQAIETLIRAWFDKGAANAYIWVSHDHEQALRMSSTQLTMSAGVLAGQLAA